MRERLTARVLLLDPDGRILLMKGRLPGRPDGPSFWYSIGGRRRGRRDAGAGPRRGRSSRRPASPTRCSARQSGATSVILRDIEQEKRLFKQYYVVARSAGGDPSREGWLPHERQAYRRHALVDPGRASAHGRARSIRSAWPCCWRTFWPDESPPSRC
ncbi:MAG: hypothetical protein WDM85_03025 [Caulobacteraceae bacterium]